MLNSEKEKSVLKINNAFEINNSQLYKMESKENVFNPKEKELIPLASDHNDDSEIRRTLYDEYIEEKINTKEMNIPRSFNTLANINRSFLKENSQTNKIMKKPPKPLESRKPKQENDENNDEVKSISGTRSASTCTTGFKSHGIIKNDVNEVL